MRDALTAPRELHDVYEKGKIVVKRLHGALMATALGLVALGTTAAPASANVTPTFVPPQTPSGLNWKYTYNVGIDAQQQMNSGNFLTFYDFVGYVPGSATIDTAGFSITEQLLGINPTVQAQPGPPPGGDNPGILNITFTRTGATIGPSVGFVVTLDSIYGPPSIGTIGTKAEAYSLVINENVSNGNTVFGPSAVPEPISAALLLPGLLPLGLAKLRRRRQADEETEA